jgi:quercetin dioxygenase-like cupin family protein
MAGEGIAGVAKRVLVSPAEGWDGWVMRLFDVEPGGHTPRHSHPWPHINFVPSGRGTLYVGGEEQPLTPGSYAFVPGGVEHQFRAAPDEPLTFICIVPSEGDY